MIPKTIQPSFIPIASVRMRILLCQHQAVLADSFGEVFLFWLRLGFLLGGLARQIVIIFIRGGGAKYALLLR